MISWSISHPLHSHSKPPPPDTKRGTLDTYLYLKFREITQIHEFVCFHGIFDIPDQICTL